MTSGSSPTSAVPPRRPPERAGIAQIVLIYAAFAALWILLSDMLVEHLFGDARSIVVAGILKGLFFVAATSALLWLLMRRLAGSETAAAPQPMARVAFILPLALVSLAIVALTVYSAMHTVASHKKTQVVGLQTIAELKSAQVAAWLGERRKDAEFLRGDPMPAGLYPRWQDGGDAAGRALLLSRLERFGKSYAYKSVLLLGRDGEPLWESGGAPVPLPPPLRPAVAQARADFRVVTVGPYRDEQGALRMDSVVPLAAASGRPGPVVVLRMDPVDSLNALLQAWPLPSASGETLLFRRDGDAALMLNELRYRPDTAAKMRVPLSERRLLSAQVLNGEARPGATIEGIDYRRAPVLGVAWPVAGTDWYLVAKMDMAELHAEGRSDAGVITLAGVLALTATLAAAQLYRKRQMLLAEQRLRAQQEERLHALQLLDAIADNSEDAIFALDRNNRFILFNNAAARKTGKAVGEIIGRDETALFPAEVAQRHMSQNLQVMESGRGESFEETLPLRDGEHTYLVAKGPLRDEHGRVFGLFGIARDITAMRRAERAQESSEARYRAVLDNAADPVLVVAPEGRLVYVNRQAAELLGYGIEELLALGLPDIVPPGGAEFAAATFERLKEQSHLLVEARLMRRDGEAVSVEINAVRLPDGNYYGACRDIAERRQAEAVLKARNEELERFNRVMVGRELDMIELKRQINALSRQLGQSPPFDPDLAAAPAQPGGAAGA